MFELAIELSSQRFVVTEHQCRPLDVLDNISHAERLAAASYAKQRLVVQAICQAFGQLGNSRWLVASWLIVALKIKLTHLSIVSSNQRSGTAPISQW